MKHFGFTIPLIEDAMKDFDRVPVVQGVLVELAEPGEVPNTSCPFKTNDQLVQHIADHLWAHYAETWLT